MCYKTSKIKTEILAHITFALYLYIIKQSQKLIKMATFKSTPILAKEVKSEMKSLGIKVLRAAQNKSGVLITIVDTLENQQKTIEYFNSNNMAIAPSLSAKVITGSTLGYIDFGTIYKWISL